jgi:hypothetical protein
MNDVQEERVSESERFLLTHIKDSTYVIYVIHLWNALIRLVGLRSNGPSGKDRFSCLIDLR